MKIFWVRFILFCGLWSLMILQHSEKIPGSILFFTIALGIFFFLSIKNALFSLFLSLSVVICSNGLLFTEDYLYTILLIVYLTIIAGTMLKEKQLYIYVIIDFVLTIIFIFLQEEYGLEMIIISSSVYFLVIRLNRMVRERHELKEIHEQFLGEYRQLKRMHVTAEREARLEERTRIARDIHDSVGHKLTALMMRLEMLAIQSGNDIYREIKQMAQESLDETRQAVSALQVEENEGIATVVHLIRKLEAESHILVQFTVKQGVLSIPLSNEKSVVLYRVIQEALTNAMRHTQAREVMITLGKSATGDISFEIINPIFDTNPFQFGFGLNNMKSRVEKIDGKIAIYQTESTFVVSGMIPSGD